MTECCDVVGVAVYFWSPLWPYAVDSLISIDGGPGECVNLRDPTRNSSVDGVETEASAPRWRRVGLQNAQHSVVVSRCANGSFVVVDAFTYVLYHIRFVPAFEHRRSITGTQSPIMFPLCHPLVLAVSLSPRRHKRSRSPPPQQSPLRRSRPT